MPTTTASHVIKVTGVSAELLDLLDARIRQQHATGRSEYIRELIRKDVLQDNGPTFREILRPIHEASRGQSYTEDELDDFFDAVREEVYQSKQPREGR